MRKINYSKLPKAKQIIDILHFSMANVNQCTRPIEQRFQSANLVLGRISNEPLGFSEGYIGGSGAVALGVSDDFHLDKILVISAGVTKKHQKFIFEY